MILAPLSFNFFNVIILLGIIHGLIFSAVVLINKKYRSRSSIYIALTISALSLSTLQYILIDIGFITESSIWYDFRIPFEFLILPMFFLYVSSYLQKKVPSNIKILLHVPFMIALAIILIMYNVLLSTE